MKGVFEVFDDAAILVTGGTGSFGNKFVPMTLKKYNPKKIVVFSRDEMKQWEMAKLFKDDRRVQFLSEMGIATDCIERWGVLTMWFTRLPRK